MASIADVLTSSVVELGSLLQAVDVDTDKPDSPQQVDLIAFVGQQASQISHESSKVSAVMMVAPTLDSCKFVSQSLLQPVIALVSASQLLCRYCGNTRKAELRGLVKGVVSGCIGLLTKLSGSSLPPTGLSHLQAAGLLFSLCEKLTQFPKSDAIAAKRKVLRLAGIIKDSLKEFREELAQVDEGEEGEEEEEEEEKACPATSSGPPPLMSSCMSVLECSLQLVHASQEVLTSLLRGRAVPAEAAAAGGSGSLSPLTLALDGICVACQAVEDAVIDFADAMNDLESRATLLSSHLELMASSEKYSVAVLDVATTLGSPDLATPMQTALATLSALKLDLPDAPE